MTEQEAIQAVRNNNKFPVWEYCDDKFGRFPLRVTAAPMRGRTEGVLIDLPTAHSLYQFIEAGTPIAQPLPKDTVYSMSNKHALLLAEQLIAAVRLAQDYARETE